MSSSVQLSIKIICQNASSDAEHYVASSKENETILQYQVKYRFKLCPEYSVAQPCSTIYRGRFVSTNCELHLFLSYQIDELSLSLESNLLALEEGKKFIMEREDELKKSR